MRRLRSCSAGGSTVRGAGVCAVCFFLIGCRVHSGVTGWGKSLRITLYDVGRTRDILRLGWEACRPQNCDEHRPHGCRLVRAASDGREIYLRQHWLVRLISERTGVGWQTRWLEMDLFGDRDREYERSLLCVARCSDVRFPASQVKTSVL